MKVVCVTAVLLAIPLVASVFWAVRAASAQTVPADKASPEGPKRTGIYPVYPQPLDVLSQPNMILENNALYFGPGNADPEMAKLHNEEANAERDVAKLVNAYAQAEGEAQRAKFKSALSAALSKSFDLQQQRRSLELARVETRLKKVRDVMQKRSEARQSIIDKRLDQVLREAEGLGWTSPPGGFNFSNTNRNEFVPLRITPANARPQVK